MAMNAERFADLAGAYGGDIRRWPQEVRDDAYGWLEVHAEARAVLVEAGELDALLNTHAPAAPSSMLRERLLFQAPRARPLWRQTSAWLSGAGLAAACAAGVMLGVNMSGSLLSAPEPAAVAETASGYEFDDGWFSDLEVTG